MMRLASSSSDSNRRGPLPESGFSRVACWLSSTLWGASLELLVVPNPFVKMMFVLVRFLRDRSRLRRVPRSYGVVVVAGCTSVSSRRLGSQLDISLPLNLSPKLRS
jgi:hypothetical protein